MTTEITTSTATVPKMLTIRQTAATGILPEHALRRMVKNGSCPCIAVGNRVYINYDKLIQQLQEC